MTPSTSTTFRFTAAAARLLLCLVSSILLVWSVHHTWGASTPSGGERRPLSITVPAPAESPDGVVRVEKIVANGRLQRVTDLRLQGGWGVERAYFYEIPVHRPGAGPGRVEIDAPSAFLTFARSPEGGTAIVEDGRSFRTSVSLASDPPDTIDVELPELGVSSWPASLVAIALVALLALARPWQSQPRLDVVLIGHLAAIHALIWLTFPIGTTNDTVWYLSNLADNFRGKPAYFPPGYGLFIGACQLLSADRLGLVAVLGQHVFMVVAIVWTCALVRRFAGAPLASLWLVVATWLAPTLFLPQVLQSENVAILGMSGALYWTVRNSESRPVLHTVLAGACASIATLTRVVPLAAVVPAAFILLTGRGWRSAVIRTTAFAAVTLVPVVGFMGWFAIKGNGFMLANSTGCHMYNRVVNYQKLLDPTGPATKQLVAELAGTDPRDLHWWDVGPRIDPKGERYADVDRLIAGVANEGLRTDPPGYLLFSFAHAWLLIVDDPTSYLGCYAMTELRPELESPAVREFSQDANDWQMVLRRAFTSIWSPLCYVAVAAVAAAWLLRERRIPLAMAAMIAGYMLATAFVEFSLGRYNVAVTQHVAALALVPLALVWLLAARVRAARAGQPGAVTGTCP